jgi:hypothetical protein
MDKVIEMTADGRLTLLWVALGFLALAVLVECFAHRRERPRRVSRR